MTMHGARRRMVRMIAMGIVAGSVLGLVSCQVSWPWRGDGSGTGGGSDSTRPETVTTGSRGVLRDRLPVSETDPTLRARIIENTTEMELGGPRFVILSVPGRSEAPITVRTPVKFSAEARQWIIEPTGSARAALQRRLAPGFDVLHVEAVGGGAVTINNQRHPGTIQLRGRDTLAGGAGSASFDVVEEISIEDYLPGVIVKEMLPGWHIEAYRAQAIAARSYALHERARRRSIGSSFDVEVTEQSQVYGGATTDPAAIEAVRSTKGMVIGQGGRLIRAYYSSTCGDRAGSAADTWPTGPGYEFNLAEPIQAHERECPCERSPRHRWSITRSRSDLEQRIRAFAEDRGMGLRDLKRIASIKASSYNTVGRPSRYEVTDTDGRSWDLSAENLRIGCNHPGPSGARLPAIEFKDRVLSGDIAFDITGDTVIINGRGFGHAVGMCQYGAQALAQQGFKGEEIIGRYYNGARVVRGY